LLELERELFFICFITFICFKTFLFCHIFLFVFLFLIYTLIHMCIHCLAISASSSLSLPPYPLASRQDLFCPLLQFVEEKT
jgi:hypothetical protein